MAINAYTGLMGSGKSFEVTASVIVPAVEKGRRVVTNIEGINEAKIHEYLISKKSVNPTTLGKVIHVKNDDIMKSQFFPDENRPDTMSVVQPGDLVCVDEAWRFWGAGQTIPPEHQQFFRMHRHYVDPQTKIACDVALIMQSVGDLHRNIRSVIEMTARTTKLKTLGLNKSYRVELFEGDKITKTSKFETFVKKYDPAIFPLYNSYAGGQGQEKAIDKRQNVLLNPRIWITGVLLLSMTGVSLYYLLHFFAGDFLPSSAGKSETHAPATSSAAQVTQTPQAAPVVFKPQDSALRVVGEVVIAGNHWIVLSDQNGRLRLENPALFAGRGLTLVGNLEGQRVATWTGGNSTQNMGIVK